MLSSPHYGERWGRHWLDLARFSESTGFEYDRMRDNAWPYRDYVIRSLNQDKPYDRFMREQIAGDVIEPMTRDGILGPSLLVCGAYDQAGNAQANATQRAITREEEMEDLLSVVGQTFLGLTVNCARCHDHKFDPIPQVEYYALRSVFDGVKHGERPFEGAEELSQRTERIREAEARLAATRAEVVRLTEPGFRRTREHPGNSFTKPGPNAVVSWDFNELPVLPAGDQMVGGAAIELGQLSLPQPGAYLQSAQLQHDIHEKSLEAWVSLKDLNQQGGAAISIESDAGDTFDAIVFGERQPGRWTAGSEGYRRTQDLDAIDETSTPDEMVHIVIVYGPGERIAIFRNGKPYGQPYAVNIPIPKFKAGKSHVLLGLRHHGGSRPWLTGALRRAALYDRPLTEDEVREAFQACQSSRTLADILAELSPVQKQAREAAIESLHRAELDLNHAKEPAPVAYAGLRVQPEPTRRLRRGDVKSPEEVLSPGALSAISGLSPSLGLAPDSPEASRRLKFAEWLCDPRNPLPARVLVNRLWQYHFGQGLVATPNDFGVNGARPSHPELLDWLATTFIESGWSIKTMQRWIVTSATYRQSSKGSPRGLELDAEDQLLWRYPPRRLEAEIVRDAMLAVSGELNSQLGGPSFRPFTTTDFNATFYFPFDKADADFNRRTVYRMNVNSGKDPFLDTLDCPDPSVKTPRRNATTTPLQALSLMNSSFVQRQADRLAARAISSKPDGLEGTIAAAYQLALGRSPETGELKRATEAARERGLFQVCWALLNSTEFLYVQ